MYPRFLPNKSKGCHYSSVYIKVWYAMVTKVGNSLTHIFEEHKKVRDRFFET